MSEPKRYTGKTEGTVLGSPHWENPEGEWVKWDDYARLQAEVERLSRPAIVGGYNLSEYIRMANSETLEFDNGDIFADMTLPERIKYIVESHARLNAEVERSRDQYNGIIDTQLAVIDSLKAEVERLKAEPDALTAYLYADTLRREDIKTLKAQVERLTKAGDAMAEEIIACFNAEGYDPADSDALTKWNAAKEGKKS